MPFEFVARVPVFGADLVSTLDHVVAGHARGDAVFARLDTARVGVFGHSFGGAAAAEACRRDRRCRAGMDLATLRSELEARKMSILPGAGAVEAVAGATEEPGLLAKLSGKLFSSDEKRDSEPAPRG